VPAAIVVVTTCVVAAILLLHTRGGSGPGHPKAPALVGTIALLPPSPLSACTGAASIWTGQQWLIWGGTGAGGRTLSDGAAYDPAQRSWGPLPSPPLPARTGSISAWTGTHWLVIGGDDDRGRTSITGATYNPATGRWKVIAPAPFPVSHSAGAVWTGTQLVIVTGAGQASRAAGYDARTNSWRVLPDPPGTAQSPFGSMVWTGRYVVTLRSARAGGSGLFVSAYDPAKNRWSTLPSPGLAGGADPTLAWTGSSLLALPTTLGGGGARYTLGSAAWQRLAPIPRANRAGVSLGGPPTWTGSAAVYWGGGDIGLVYDSRTGQWENLPAGELPGRQDPMAAWTGQVVLAWGGIRDGAPAATGVAYTPPG
jgi:hypothetical protein